MQAKQRNIETELNDTKAELQEIKLRQQELEERNRLLEKVADLSKSNSMEDDAQSPIQVQCMPPLLLSLITCFQHHIRGVLLPYHL